MHNRKAAGGSGVVAEMLKFAGELAFDLITDLFNTIIKEKNYRRTETRASFSTFTKAKEMQGGTTEASSCFNM